MKFSGLLLILLKYNKKTKGKLCDGAIISYVKSGGFMLKISKSSQPGFTLIELLTFIVALAILIVIIISFQVS